MSKEKFREADETSINQINSLQADLNREYQYLIAGELVEDEMAAAEIPKGELPDLEEELPEELRGAVRDILACDPRTAYINDPERIWGVAYGGYNIRFTVQDMVCRVVEVQKTE